MSKHNLAATFRPAGKFILLGLALLSPGFKAQDILDTEKWQNWLDDRGMYLDAAYTADNYAFMSGGVDQGFETLGNLDIAWGLETGTAGW